jgi:hypothetical protein
MSPEDYHLIKRGEEEVRIFKSLNSRRLTEFDETFDEYRLRRKIMMKVLKAHKVEGRKDEATDKI